VTAFARCCARGVVAAAAKYSNAEVDHARRILARGTSADRQLALYQQQLDRGLNPSQALKAIVDQLVVETVANVKAFGPTALAACA
jgi:carboxylate-amine ligase